MPNFNVPGLGVVAGGTATATDAVFDTTVPNGSGRIQLKTAGTRFGFMGTGAWALGDATTDLALVADTGGALKFGTNGALKGQMTSGGVFAWGTPTTTAAGAGDIVLANLKALRGVNAAGSTTVTMVSVDVNNIVQLGQSTNPPAMPVNTSTTFGGTSAGQKGLHFVPSDLAGTFVFYDGVTGARYKVIGTAF